MARTRGVAPQQRAGLDWNRFFECRHSIAEVSGAASDLSNHLSGLPPEGSKEQPLLDFIGASTQRIALFGYAGGHVLPTHVARELVLGDMRADFALLSLPEDTSVPPRLLLVECQGAFEKSIFEQGNRQRKYWGYDFLDGFSQLVDWKHLDNASVSNQQIANLTQRHLNMAQVSYMLVVGLRRFVQDHISSQRFQWWAGNITLGKR